MFSKAVCIQAHCIKLCGKIQQSIGHEDLGTHDDSLLIAKDCREKPCTLMFGPKSLHDLGKKEGERKRDGRGESEG